MERRVAIRRPVRRLAAIGMVLSAGLLPACSSVAGAQTGSSEVPVLSGPMVPDFADLVAKVKPGVVSITSRLEIGTATTERGARRAPPFPFGQSRPPQRAVESRGSGFIIGPDGTIVTNNHVVENAVSVAVTLDDGGELPARIIGRDVRTDIAVLKVNAARALPALQLGDSAALRVGAWVVAMGNPFGLGGTATAGIVSAEGRDIGAGPYDQFIQIDAPINQGNSGGPLFTQDGKVVGMTSVILSPSGGSIGIGFAIPSNVIATIVQQLETTGHIVRGYIGVETQDVSQALARALQLPDAAGVLIAGVAPGSPAARAGMAAGDVVRAVNGHSVATPRDLAQFVADIRPGGSARLDMIRAGRAMAVTLTVAELPEASSPAVAPQPAPAPAGLGLALGPLLPELRRQLDLPADTVGAVVARVVPLSPADNAGLMPGDIIVGVGGMAVANPDQAARLIRQAEAEQSSAVLLRILRDGHAAFVAVDLGQPHPAGNG